MQMNLGRGKLLSPGGRSQKVVQSRAGTMYSARRYVSDMRRRLSGLSLGDPIRVSGVRESYLGSWKNTEMASCSWQGKEKYKDHFKAGK